MLSMWYKHSESQKRFTIFAIGPPVAGAFGGLLASAIGLMDGIRGYHAWRWVFILEGCASCVVAGIAYLTIPDFPDHAKWLDDDERTYVVARLAADHGSSDEEQAIDLAGILEAFRDWRMVPGALMFFGLSVSGYGV